MEERRKIHNFNLKDNMLIPEENHKTYKIKASPFFWREKAEQLRHAFEVLWPDCKKRYQLLFKQTEKTGDIDLKKIPPDTYSICIAIMGYSIECLFKACIIRDHPEYVTNGRLARHIKSHDLIKLADQAGVELSAKEKAFCKRAIQAIEGNARYPVGLQSKPNEDGITINTISPDVYRELYDKIYPTVSQFHVDGGSFESDLVVAKKPRAKKTRRAVVKSSTKK